MEKRNLRLLAITLVVVTQHATGQDLRSEKNAVSDRNWKTLLRYLEPALKAAGGAGRLYYRADCWTSGGDGILFPSLELDNPARSTTGLKALQAIFRKEKDVTVKKDRFGINRISIGNISYELLSTKIHALQLSPREQYNTEDAILAIEQTKEVQAKLQQLGLQEPPTVYFGRVLEPAPGLPHLPALMTDLTMDEALDQMARAFGGLVIYGECESSDGTHLFSVDFAYIR